MTQLYRHFDAEGRLLYVGISLSAIYRLRQHRDNSHWFEQIVRVEISRYPDRQSAAAAEVEAIRNERPLHNISATLDKARARKAAERAAFNFSRSLHVYPLCELRDLHEQLRVSRTAIRGFIEMGLLATVELPKGPGGTMRRYVTGNQLIAFLEQLESEYGAKWNPLPLSAALT